MWDVKAGVILEVVNRDRLGQTSGVALPRAKVAEDHVVGDPISIGRVGDQSTLVHRQRLWLFALNTDTKLSLRPAVRGIPTREKHDALAVRSPCDHFVVNTHAVV